MPDNWEPFDFVDSWTRRLLTLVPSLVLMLLDVHRIWLGITAQRENILNKESSIEFVGLLCYMYVIQEVVLTLSMCHDDELIQFLWTTLLLPGSLTLSSSALNVWWCGTKFCINNQKWFCILYVNMYIAAKSFWMYSFTYGIKLRPKRYREGSSYIYMWKAPLH